MTTIRLILGDQLSRSISSLSGCNKKQDVILMAEVRDECTYVKHHKKKLILLLSAMRHFADELREDGHNVDYISFLDQGNSHSLLDEIEKAIKKHKADRLVVTFPGEYRLLKKLEQLQGLKLCEVEIREDERFLCSHDDFAAWADGQKHPRMEYFYRKMRIKHNILMEGDQPAGGKWNFDHDNRNYPKDKLDIPQTYTSSPDKVTREVIELVEREFTDHFGESDDFHFAVTRKQARAALGQFIKQRLHKFGDYQDAMIEGEDWMYHSHLSFYINCGLLLPLECIEAAEKAYTDKQAPLNCVEGFIRQILGWREYVRGIYWLKMPGLAEQNFLEAKNKLPEVYWSGKSKMNCINQCVTQTKKTAYAHHIQRLMVLGNFALLIGADPAMVNEWYLIVYADAYEWVEMPNVSGMILFADGGYLASKPYAASGAYINKMSNYCKNCEYKVTEKNGPKACPFNYLYWDFLARNRQKLEGNQRINVMYKTYDRMSDEKKAAIKKDSAAFLKEVL